MKQIDVYICELKNIKMRKLMMMVVALIGFSTNLFAQQYKVITVVESIVPGGMGRSRLIDSKEEVDYKKMTTSREDGKDSDQGKVDRSDAKIDRCWCQKNYSTRSRWGIS